MFDSVSDIAAREHIYTRNWNRAELETPDHRDLPFRQTREHDENAIAAAYTELLQQIGEAVREDAYFGKGEAALATLFVTPDQRELIRILRPNVNDIAPKVEAGRNSPAKRAVGCGVIEHHVSFYCTPAPCCTGDGEQKTFATTWTQEMALAGATSGLAATCNRW
jgi:hypothetical protein